MYTQIANVITDNLTDEQQSIIDGAEMNNWIEIVDGDFSAQYELDFNDIIDTATLIARIEAGELDGALEANKEFPDDIAAILPFVEEKDAYWAGNREFQVKS